MQANTKMDILIKDMDITNTSNAVINLNQLFKLLQPTIKNVYGCLIIDNNDDVEPSTVNFEKILQIHGDKTGYEASSNEIRINDFINGDIKELKDILAVGFMVLDIWALRLKDAYSDQHFCLIISAYEDSVTIRFHQIRDNESSWLSDDLEKYKDTAVAFKTI